MKPRTRIKLAFLLPLDADDLRRLTSSLALLTTPGQMRLYRLLAKAPLFLLTTVGGWSIKRTIAAYISILGVFLIPSFKFDAIAFFALTMLFTFGRNHYSDTMMRLHVVRRLRATPEALADIEAEPALALLLLLKGACSPRSLTKYAGLADKVYFLKRVVYYPSMVCLGLFVGGILAMTASIWIPALRVIDGTMVMLTKIGAYGIVFGMIALLSIYFIGTMALESEKPVIVGEHELSVLGVPEDAESDKE